MYTYKNHQYWMRYALKLAIIAGKKGEVPVGSILVFKKKIIAEGYNASICHNDPTAHAEILALRQGGKKLKNYRLLNTTLYVTLEPCIMCFGAIIQSRIGHLVFGAKEKTNKLSILKKYLKNNIINHKFNITESILLKECSDVLNKFFKKRRKS
ncbi:tRNA adenosine(34) deaminase TadA [Buchnera aphidicola]|uniref:tRNA adenosine(34) deaminase TadA n=1 Tax=Buchnera aphidicola TaxID=9 RepID=UPI003463D43F